MSGAVPPKGTGWISGSQDPSCFPEGVRRDVSGQTEETQRCAGSCGMAVPLVGLPKVVTRVPTGCARGSSDRSPSFVAVYL